MKQAQLKKLAKWANIRLMVLEDKTLAVAIPYQINELKGNLPDKLWQPHKNSNQLDMLEDKMIEGMGVERIELQPTEESWLVDYEYNFGAGFVSAEGKTKNEARLNAILNYVEVAI